MNDPGLDVGWIGLGLALLLLASLAWSWGRGQLQRAGLPEGDVIYSDSGSWFPLQEPLYSSHLRLVGRPDYLVQEPDGQLVPVEVKSAAAPRYPHDGHLLQLAAYCLLVEENYGLRPAYGILQYQDKSFEVDYTIDLEEDLLDLLTEMRGGMFEESLDRDHQQWQRCASCGVRSSCDQRLD